MPRYIDATDLVRRWEEKKMRLIDADALMEELINELGDGEVLYRIPPDYIDDAPTIDAVEVVRCKECKRFMWFTEEYAKKIGFDGTCNLLAGYTDCGREMRKRMDYCSYGERWEG